ncbi:MAG: ABC transporter ATP-binding protein [Desulfobacterales bacterium]|nr:ABC transporter ATP-binding protein [Desulfobacterales bacterium]
MNILQARDLTKTYRIDGRHLTVLEDVSLSARHGEFLVVSGASGSGKSTLLSLLSGLDKPSQGRVFIQGKDITDISEDDLAPFRNRVFGFVFQSFHLIPSLSALENVMFPAELANDRDAEKNARDLLERVGLAERGENFPHQLSGGEKQRVAICRALVNRPKIIFADEPTGNLDSENGRSVLELLLDFQQASQTTLVLVTHNPDIAKRADRVVVLADGRLARGADHGA